ncbi:MAG: DUF302 domain-containing protein [Pseudomonadota bacterium]
MRRDTRFEFTRNMLIRWRSSAVVMLMVFGLAGALAIGSPAVQAETKALGYQSMSVEAAFEDVVFDIKDAIVNRGLVIDYTGHVDKMLERTSKAVGSETAAGSKSPYLHAKYFQFCSAKITHEVVSANALNLAICPYVVFAYELKSKPGTVHVGFRRPIADPSRRSQAALAKVEALLLEIIKEATSG